MLQFGFIFFLYRKPCLVSFHYTNQLPPTPSVSLHTTPLATVAEHAPTLLVFSMTQACKSLRWSPSLYMRPRCSCYSSRCRCTSSSLFAVSLFLHIILAVRCHFRCTSLRCSLVAVAVHHSCAHAVRVLAVDAHHLAGWSPSLNIIHSCTHSSHCPTTIRHLSSSLK